MYTYTQHCVYNEHITMCCMKIMPTI